MIKPLILDQIWAIAIMGAGVRMTVAVCLCGSEYEVYRYCAHQTHCPDCIKRMAHGEEPQVNKNVNHNQD